MTVEDMPVGTQWELGPVEQYFDHLEDPEFIVLQAKPGAKLLVFDPGLPNIATCRSSISYLNGIDGRLEYRGQPIDEIAGSRSYLDVAFELLEPDPAEADRDAFTQTAQTSLLLHPEVQQTVSAMPATAHPMDMLAAGLLAASSLDARVLGEAPAFRDRAAYLIAQTHVCAALVARRLAGQDWTEFDDGGDSYMVRVVRRLVDPAALSLAERAEVLDTVLVLHAEHDQNCSTSTVRNVASAGGDLFTAACAGVFAFKAPLHGGASEQVPKMLEEIVGSGMTGAEFVEASLRNKTRLMGFGHRVYDCWDPRARFMHAMLESAPEKYADVTDLRRAVLELIDATGESRFFKDRNICPNPDLFNGILFRWIGVPPAMNGVMLSMSRVAGWAAHYAEQIADRLPIVRPRQLRKSGAGKGA